MTATQVTRATLYGLVFWFFAAMVVHFRPALFDGGSANAVLLAASVPVCWLSIPVSRWASGVDARHVLDANVVAIIVAALADGIGITFLPDQLYAGVSAASQFGAAWILWGVAWILLFAMMARRRT